MEHRIEQYFPQLAEFLKIDKGKLDGFLTDLRADGALLRGMNERIVGVAEFGGKQFTDVAELRTYRVLLYLIARAVAPRLIIETGVQNGMSSAFILQALEHNGSGRLISIDLPPLDARILEQGTNPLPADKAPGWIIPDRLRTRHDLRLGPAERLLPHALEAVGEVDVFLHDSDHSYEHIMLEVSLAWRYLARSGCILVDNVEQNAAFDDFARGCGAKALTIASFEGADRTWLHGLMRR